MIPVAKENRQALPEVELTRQVARWMRPDRVFLGLGLVFGIAMLLIVPPFQVPDEPTHFLRAYQVSQGQWTPTWHNNVGFGVMPISINQIFQPFLELRHGKTTTSRDAILRTLRIPLQPEKSGVYAIISSSSYSPIVFLPQAAGIALGRMMQWPPLVLMYLGRLGNLLVWIALGYAALRIAPGFGRPLLLLMLMPMSLFQAASLSPDALTNGLAFLVTAIAFRFVSAEDSDGPSPIGWRWLVIFVLSASALSLTKAAYLPLAGLILLVPPARIGGYGKYASLLLLVAAASVIPLFLWARQTPGLDMVIYSGPDHVSARDQVQFLESHPTALAEIPFFTAQRESWLIALSFVGRLGWLNIQLSPIFVLVYLILLVFACRPSADEPARPFPRRMIWVMPVVLAGAVGGVLLLNYLFWTPVGTLGVVGLQGRYFIPIAPALLLFVSGIWRALPMEFRAGKSEDHRSTVAAGISLISCVYALTILYLHFFVQPGVGST
jgi:uncharacterized membrane protein